MTNPAFKEPSHDTASSTHDPRYAVAQPRHKHAESVLALRYRPGAGLSIRHPRAESVLALRYRPGAILSNQPRPPQPGRSSRISAVSDQRAPVFGGVGEPLCGLREVSL